MKIRLIAIILALAALSWAQTPTPTKPNATEPSTAAAPAATKADCPCCQKMAEGNAGESCCAHHQDASVKSEASCCERTEGKEAISCMKGDKDKSADACCENGKCGEGKEGCCSKSEKTTEHTSMVCCATNGEHCGMAHHEHADINK
jgi:hypothetical protein